MNQIGDGLKKILRYLKKRWFVFFAILFYTFFMVYYMGPSVFSCNTTVYGFGDNTAGPIWQASLPETQGPIGSFTSMTNAPYGDNLENPIGYSLIAQTILIRTTTAIAGPICGYNIANMLGFVLSAMIMFGFILAVTRNKWIALIAGYAASFAPYFQLKIGAHFSFGFQAIFIGILWAFYNLLKYKRKKDVVILAALVALAVYWDPYYSLLAALIVVPLGIVWFLLHWRVFTKKFWKTASDKLGVKKQLKMLLTSVTIVITLLLPLIYVMVSQGAQISENVSSSRGNILLETKYCSSWPHEYLVPFMFNPFFEKLIGKDLYTTSVSVLRDHYSCGIGEDVVGLSITMVLILTVGTTVIAWERLNKRRLKFRRYLDYEPRMLIYGLAAIVVACLALSLPPMVVHGVPTPSYLMLEVTSTWRTITRIFVILNIAIIALSSIVMLYFYKRLNLAKYKWVPIILVVAIFGAILVEYQTSTRPFAGNDFGTFDYTKSVPEHYNWLKKQNDIKTIAEYPLERSGGEGNSMAYYLTMQVVHGKKLFNGSIGYSIHEKKKTGLKNLYDPQTLPVLKAMGVDAVVIHGITREQVAAIPYADIIYSAKPSGFTLVGFSPLVTNDEVYIISLKNVPSQDYIVAPADGFFRNMTYVRSAVDWRYLSAAKSTMNVVALDGSKLSDVREVCFNIMMVAPTDSGIVTVDSPVAQSLQITLGGTPQTVRIQAKGQVDISNSIGTGMVVSRLGCGH